MKALSRVAWLIVGITALVLGVIGIPLPLLPTTPFILLAAFAFARSSTRLHDWLVQHRTFGPLIANWRQYGAISRRAKWISLASMMGVFGVSLVLKVPTHALLIQAVVLTGSAIFIASRPLPPESV